MIRGPGDPGPPAGRVPRRKTTADARVRRALGPVLARAPALMGVDAPVLERIGRALLPGGGRQVGGDPGGVPRAVRVPSPRTAGRAVRNHRDGGAARRLT